ncbi:hypothetical protein [uncultured Cohaesibacter sp.]|uniref:hypothetical protein n=1 Tax=uncultured Cohaesibacter sp. TaxID=1002546 RepID=UPI0029C75808|nr:hypothetical protein [uncultured Cohaesibacter sp.]
MGTDVFALEALISDIADFAKTQIETSDLSGPRFGSYVKLSWFGQSGTPCYSDCQNLIDALQTLREFDDTGRIDSFYVAMTAALVEYFPDMDNVPADFDAIRRMSAQLGKVA